MDIEKELEKIYARNRRVEADKAWEVSWTRCLFIAVITYIIAVIWLLTIHERGAYLKAVIPVAGFVLSTFSLPVIKRWWIGLTQH